MYFNSENTSVNGDGDAFNEFTPDQPIFPNLSPMEEKRLLLARIMELDQSKKAGTSSSISVIDDYGMNDDVSSCFGEDDQQGQDERAKTPNIGEAIKNGYDLKALLQGINALEQKQSQQQQQNEKALIGQIEKLQQQKQLESISEMEKQQTAPPSDQPNATQQQLEDRSAKPQNDQKQTALCAKIDELETNMNQLMDKIFNKLSEFDNFNGVVKDRFGSKLLEAVHPKIRTKICEKFSSPQQNCWDANACHRNLQIFVSECLIIHYKGDKSGWATGFAKFSVPSCEFGIFYMEVKIINVKTCVQIGFATKAIGLDEKTEGLDNCHYYVYRSKGELETHGSYRRAMPKYSRDDVIGCGINLASRRLILTKNGQPLDTADLFAFPTSSANDGANLLFPCVSLLDKGDLIEAKFDPNYQFDPASVEKFSSPQKQKNCWDSAVCHNELSLSGPHSSIVHYKGNGDGWRSVFALDSILHSAGADSIDFFYFEVKVKTMKNCALFGFAVKQKTPLDLLIRNRFGTYAFEANGTVWAERKSKSVNAKFSDGDTVGCGVNLANQQLIFTKNGQRSDANNLLLNLPSVPTDALFPFVSLADYGDKIKTNFGPKFMFDLTTL